MHPFMFKTREVKFFSVGSLTSGAFVLADSKGITIGHVTVNEKDGLEKFTVTSKFGHFSVGENRKV